MSKDEIFQLCIACNKMHSSSKTTCDCGHVLSDAITLQNGKGHLRQRREPYRPNSVSSELIGKTFKEDIKAAMKENRDIINITSPKRSTYKTQKKSYKAKHCVKRNVLGRKRNLGSLSGLKEEKKQQIKEILDLIEHSYQNIYFSRCKSYPKLKITDFDFEFDFSTFESHTPYYPTALEDINAKLVRTTTFKKVIDE